MDNLALFLHLLGALLFVSGIVLAGTSFEMARRRGGLGGQRPKQARRLAGRLAAEDGPASEELRALLDDRLSLAANYGSLLLTLVILALMVFKP